MRKYLIFSLLLSILLVGGQALAQTEVDTAQTEAASAETVTTEDLGIANPGLLPTNPFYFLKEFGRNVRRVFTFDSVKKAELELSISNEKAAELKKVEETQPQNMEAIQSAMQNYQKNQQRLMEKFENLKSTSSNPNVEKLLQTFADRAVKHEKVFDELQNKFENNAEVTKIVNEVKQAAGEVAAAAAGKDEPTKFAAKIEQALTTEKGSDLKHIRSIEILDNFIQKAPEAVKVSLEKVKEDVSARLQIDIKNAIQTQGAETVKQVIMDLPGNTVRRAVILKELEQKAGTAAAGVLESAVATLNKEILSSENIMEKAQAQLQSAGDILSKLDNRLMEPARAGIDAVSVPVNVKELYEKARNSYAKAKTAFEEKKYGEAFGQATSVESVVRNALRALEKKTVPQAESWKADLNRLAEMTAKYAEVLNSKNITVESNPKVYEFIVRAKELLSLARDAYAKNDSESVQNYIKQIKDHLNNLARFIEGEVRTENKVPELRTVVSTLVPRASVCDNAKRTREQLDVMLKAGEINETTYKLKLESVTKELSRCDGTSSSGSGSITVPVPTTVVRPVEPSAPAPAPIISNKGFSGAYWQCYDGQESKDSSSCKSSEEWQAEAKKFCEGHCYADNSKCGVNSFSVSNYCQETNFVPVPSTSSGGQAVPVPTTEILPTSVSSGGASVSTGIANPASTNCVKQGYKNEIRTDSTGGQYGVCIFPNGKECEEWKFYRGECVNTESACGAKPVLPATPTNCRYDGPYCLSGKWDYKLVCEEKLPTTNSAVPSVQTTSGSAAGSTLMPTQ